MPVPAPRPNQPISKEPDFQNDYWAPDRASVLAQKGIQDTSGKTWNGTTWATPPAPGAAPPSTSPPTSPSTPSPAAPNTPWANSNSQVNLPGFDSSRTDNDPKMEFGRFAQDWQSQGKQWGADAVRAFVAQDPRWEIDPNSSPNDPHIRVKQDALNGWKPGTSIWQDVITDAGPGGKNGVNFSNVYGDPAQGYAAPGSGGAFPPGQGPGGSPQGLAALGGIPGISGNSGFAGGSGVSGTSGVGGSSSSSGFNAPGATNLAGLDPSLTTRDNSLWGQLASRSAQGLGINPKDPVIANQVNAYRAEQERGLRNQIDASAESQGPMANLSGEKRLGSEHAAQATGALQSQLMSNELTSRRTEIQNALTQMGGMLSSDQQLALTQQMNAIDAYLRQQGITNQNNQFLDTFNQSNTQNQNYWDWTRTHGAPPGA